MEQYQKYKKPKETLSLRDLQKGDNAQWSILFNFYYTRLKLFVPVPDGYERFKEDIAATALADIYIARSMFDSVDRMINHLFATARYHAHAVMARKEGKLVLDDDLLIKLGERLPDREEMTVEQRAAYERWKDAAVKRILSIVPRLPSRWKTFLLSHLGYGRNEYIAHQRAAGIFSNIERGTMAEKLRLLLEAAPPKNIYEMQEQEMREALRSLSPKEKKVLIASTDGVPVDIIALKLDITQKEVHKYLGKCTSKLKGVVNLPDVFGSSLDFVRYIADGTFKELVKQELIEGNTPRRPKTLSTQQVREIILLRDQQRMAWYKIGDKMGCTEETAKKAYDSIRGSSTKLQQKVTL